MLQGQGGALANMLTSTSAFTQNLAARDQLIGDVITNLNTVLGTVDEKGRAVRLQRRRIAEAHLRPVRGARPHRRRHRTAGLGRERPDRHAGQVASSAAGRHRERAAAGAAPRRTQGRRQQGDRAAGRELPAAQRAWRLRLVLQHLLLLDPDEGQRSGR